MNVYCLRYLWSFFSYTFITLEKSEWFVRAIRDAPLDFKGGEQEVFVKKKNLTHSKVKKKKLDPHMEGKKKPWPTWERKKKNLSWSGEKKTYPHIEEGSLCHRPSNCNLSNLCGLYKSLAPEIVSWFLRFAESLAPPGKLSRLRHSRFALEFSRASGAPFWSQLPRIESLTKTEEGEKSTPGTSVIPRGRGEATLKRRVSFWSVTMTFPSKVQPAGGCFELQTLYGACRVFVLKSSKSQDILVKIGCFTQNGDLSNTHTPTPAHIHTFKFGFLHFGAVVRFV